MKKIAFLVVLLVFSAMTAVDAQRKISNKKEENKLNPVIYFRGGLGYAVPSAGAAQGPVFSFSGNGTFPMNGGFSGTYLPTNNMESFNLDKYSYSAGLHGVFGIGVMLNDYIGAEVSADIGLSTSKMETSLFFEEPQVRTFLDVEQQADLPVMITPSIVLQTGGKTKLYARGGVVLPVASSVIQQINYREERYNPADSSYVNRTVNLTDEIKMRFSPGFSGAMGAKFRLGPQTILWAEAGITSMSLYYKESEITSFTQNGQSVLNQLSPSQRITSYEFDATTNGNSNVMPTIQTPFSNFNISIGVIVGL